MHICLVHFEYPIETSVGGVGTYQKINAEMLKKYGHDVTVIAGALKKDQDYFENGVHIIRLKKGYDPYDTVKDCYNYRVRIANVIEQIDKKNEIDIIEIPDLGAEGIIYQRNKKRKIPIIVKLHTPTTIITEFNGGATTFTPDVQKTLADWEDEFICNADGLISCTKILSKMIKDRFPKIKGKNIKVVYNVANLSNFYPKQNNHNSKIILYCGTLEQRKGLFMLARAIPIVIDKLKDEEIKFDFIGDDLYRNDRLILTSEYILSLIPSKYHKYIRFLGLKTNNELNDYFNNARLGVIPSLFDNLPYVAMEELATEMPLIASNNTGIKEFIVNNESGILYDPMNYEELASKIIYLYNNPEIARTYGINGKNTIKDKFSAENIIKQTEKIYREVINEYKNKRND